MEAYSQYKLQPYIPDSSLPINIQVFHGDSPSPHIDARGLRSGVLYLGPSEIWIIQSSQWVEWKPAQSLLLDFDGEELWTAPCVTQGLRMVTTEDQHVAELPRVRRELGLGPSDDITAPVLQRIKMVTGIKSGNAGNPSGQVCNVELRPARHSS